jgi:tetratricopeptide (TPR) repeat protein
MRRRRFDEALREAQLTLYLAPVSSRFEAGIAQVLHFSGRYSEALEACERSLALDPANVVAHYFRAAAQNASGNYTSALQTWSELAARGADVRQDLGFTYARMGRRQEALAILDTLKSEWRGARNARESAALAIPVATVLMGLESDEQALEWLERGAITGDVAAYLAINPRWRPLHPVARFRALLRRVGLHDVKSAIDHQIPNAR